MRESVSLTDHTHLVYIVLPVLFQVSTSTQVLPEDACRWMEGEVGIHLEEGQERSMLDVRGRLLHISRHVATV